MLKFFFIVILSKIRAYAGEAVCNNYHFNKKKVFYFKYVMFC